MGLSGPHAGAGIHPPHRGRTVHRRLYGQLALERLSGNPRPHLRPTLRARLPARPRRGRAGGDLPAEAGRRRQQGRRLRLPAQGPGGKERQARGAGRRRAGLADGRPRPRAARLRHHHLRRRAARRRHDPQPDPALSPARGGDRRGGRLHRRHRQHRYTLRPTHRKPEVAPRRALRRGLRRQRRAARPRPRPPGPQGGRGAHPYRHRLALQRLVRPYREDRQTRRRPRRRQHGDGLLPHRSPPRRRGGQGRRPLRLRGDEGLSLGEGGRDARRHPDPQLPRAEGIHACRRAPDRRRVRESRSDARRQGPAPAPRDRRAGRHDRMRRRAHRRSGRRTPSPGSSATSASSSTAGGCRRSIGRPCSRRTRRSSSAATAAFGPKNIIWAVAHGHEAAISIDALLPRRQRRGAPAPDGEPRLAEDGHPRVVLRQRDLARPPLQGAAARPGGLAQGHQGRGRARLRPPARLCRNAALPQLRRPDGVHARPVHRVRRLRRHLPDRLHHLHGQRAGG